MARVATAHVTVSSSATPTAEAAGAAPGAAEEASPTCTAATAEATVAAVSAATGPAASATTVTPLAAIATGEERVPSSSTATACAWGGKSIGMIVTSSGTSAVESGHTVVRVKDSSAAVPRTAANAKPPRTSATAAFSALEGARPRATGATKTSATTARVVVD
jgi:hypothetical protein